MPSALKVLGQSNPSATTLTTAYTVPASTTVVGSSIVICNRSNVATSFRIAIAIAGAADDPKQYIAYDTPIDGNEIITLTIGFTLSAADLVKVYATLATLSFNVFGEEQS